MKPPRTARRPWHCAALLGAALLAPGCFQPASADEAQDLHDALVGWLECGECVRDELKAVVKHGEKAVPTLTAVWRQGPSAATLEVVVQRARVRYAQLVAARGKAGSGEPLESEKEFIARNLAAYKDRYRARAATALGEIGTPAAISGLCKVSPDGSQVLRDARLRALVKANSHC